MTEGRERCLLTQISTLEAENARLRAELAALRQAHCGAGARPGSEAATGRRPQSILHPGLPHISLQEVVARHGEPPWSERAILTEQMQASIICQAGGHPNDRHYHIYDEWWVVMQGEIHWEMEGLPEPVQAKAGDFVYCPSHHFHHIHPKGDGITIRLGVGVAGEYHRQER